MKQLVSAAVRCPACLCVARRSGAGGRSGRCRPSGGIGELDLARPAADPRAAPAGDAGARGVAVFHRPDGAYQAIPAVQGRTKTFHIVERAAPWTLKPGMTVMANTYNGVVPGPALVVNQGDTRRDRLHERRHDARFDSSARHSRHSRDDGRRRRHFAAARAARADTSSIASSPISPARSSTTRTTTRRCSTRASTARSSSSRAPRPVERDLAHDFLEMISSWQIQSARRKPIHAQRQRVSGDARARRAPRRAFSHSLDQHLGRRVPHDAHARPLSTDRRARRGARRLPRRRRYRAGRAGPARRRRRRRQREAGNVADSLSRPGSYRRRERHARRPDHGDSLRRHAEHADRDVPRDDAGGRRDDARAELSA